MWKAVGGYGLLVLEQVKEIIREGNESRGKSKANSGESRIYLRWLRLFLVPIPPVHIRKFGPLRLNA